MCETGMVELCGNMKCPSYLAYIEQFLEDEREEPPPALEGQGPPTSAGGASEAGV